VKPKSLARLNGLPLSAARYLKHGASPDGPGFSSGPACQGRPGGFRKNGRLSAAA